MKKSPNNKKKIYLVNLPYDGGELWLDENKKPLSWIHCNDATWRDEYQNFIIEYLGGELVKLKLKFTEEDIDNLEECDCMEYAYEIIENKL